jgi:hypothetical protein
MGYGVVVYGWDMSSGVLGAVLPLRMSSFFSAGYKILSFAQFTFVL